MLRVGSEPSSVNVRIPGSPAFMENKVYRTDLAYCDEQVVRLGGAHGEGTQGFQILGRYLIKSW